MTVIFAACAGTPEALEAEAEPRPGIFSRTLNVVRGSPDRIETAGRKDTDRLRLQLAVTPEEVDLSSVRRLEVTATISNPTRRTMSLHFPTGQRMEIVIENAEGAVVVRWSEDRMFAQMLGHVAINPGESLEHRETISIRDVVAGKKYRLVFSVPGYPDLTEHWEFTPR